VTNIASIVPAPKPATNPLPAPRLYLSSPFGPVKKPLQVSKLAKRIAAFGAAKYKEKILYPLC